ncbi:enoyl-CoA hydratase/isomerase family protein, partial [Nocardia sp. NPDC060220]
MSENQPTRLIRDFTEAGAEFATITLDHPPLNLFDRTLIASLIADIAAVRRLPPRALLIRAEGKVVSGGVDVNIFDGRTVEEGAQLWRELFEQ